MWLQDGLSSLLLLHFCILDGSLGIPPRNTTGADLKCPVFSMQGKDGNMEEKSETGSHSVTQARVQWNNQLTAASNSWAQVIPQTSASQVAGTLGARCHILLIFSFFLKTRSCYVVQAGIELLALSEPPTSVSQVTGTTSVSHHTQQWTLFGTCLGSEPVMIHTISFHWLLLPAMVLICHPGWSAVVQSQLTAASTSCTQAVLFPQPPERSLALSPGWSAVVQSRLTATLVSQVQVIPLPQSPE
ncbi:EEF1A lysine methyltransferase 2 [Plecturocebus cupreus]